nr:MAG TPA: hypothetical protein [Caudoviricetes sp.]
MACLADFPILITTKACTIAELENIVGKIKEKQ